MTAPKPNRKRGATPTGGAPAKPRRAAAKPAPGRPSAPPATAAADDPARFSRTEWLAGIVRERILNGTYQPGERIREVQLRGEFVVKFFKAVGAYPLRHLRTELVQNQLGALERAMSHINAD